MNDVLEKNKALMHDRMNAACIHDVDQSLFGLEIEQFLVKEDTNVSIGYYGEEGVEGVLSELRPCYDDAVYSEGHLIGLTRPDLSITIEPAAQFEISLAPQTDMAGIHRIYQGFENEILPVLTKRKLKLLPRGYQPKSRIGDLKLIPKKRYEYMYQYFERHGGGLGVNMMKGTASVHISIDYRCETSFRKKYMTAYILTPLLALMTEYADTFEGRPYHGHLLRMKIWEKTDPLRVDIRPFIRDGEMNFDRYINFILQAPVIVEEGSKKDEEFYSEETIGSLLSKKVYDEAGIEHMMSMVFPLVRVKSFIEIRVADSLPYPELMAYTLLIKGIFSNFDAGYLYAEELLHENPGWFKDALTKIEVQGARASFAQGDAAQMAASLLEFSLSHLSGKEKAYLGRYEKHVKETGRFL